METGQPFVLVDVPEAPLPIFAVSQGLTTRTKWIFVATNIPYWCLAIGTLTASAVQSVAPACAARVCATVLFHGCVLTLLATVSTVWHLAQCQLLECCRLAEKADGERTRRTAAVLKSLLVGDVLCSVVSFVEGLVCFSPTHTVAWLAVPFGVFLVARRAKVRREHESYALLHGLWHVLSATAIWQIVFTPLAFKPP